MSLGNHIKQRFAKVISYRLGGGGGGAYISYTGNPCNSPTGASGCGVVETTEPVIACDGDGDGVPFASFLSSIGEPPAAVPAGVAATEVIGAP